MAEQAQKFASFRATETFTQTIFDRATVEHRLRELAFLNSGVNIILKDEREDTLYETTLHYEGGITEFVRYLDKAKNPLHSPPISISKSQGDITVELSMEWTDSYHETTLCFTNNIPQRDGGTHLAGLRGGLTRMVGNFVASSPQGKKEKFTFTGARCSRRPYLRPFRQGSGTQILLSNERQACFL